MDVIFTEQLLNSVVFLCLFPSAILGGILTATYVVSKWRDYTAVWEEE